jgi:hypothetical protein
MVFSSRQRSGETAAIASRRPRVAISPLNESAVITAAALERHREPVAAAISQETQRLGSIASSASAVWRRAPRRRRIAKSGGLREARQNARNYKNGEEGNARRRDGAASARHQARPATRALIISSRKITRQAISGRCVGRLSRE